MFIRILKKDFKRKKGITVILFIFMVMATLFISVSVNNIFQVLNSTDYSLEMGKVPDIYINCPKQKDGRNIEDWIKNNELVSDYSAFKAVFLTKAEFESINGISDIDYKKFETIMAQSQCEELMPLYDSDNRLAQVNEGEVAICKKFMKKNNLKVGNTITLRLGDYVKTFNISKTIQDPALGSDFTSISRFLFNEKDYADLEANSDNISVNYGINTKNSTKFLKDYNRQDYDTFVILEKSIFKMTYALTLVTAAVLIILGIILIIISFLVLRFSINFTIEEEFKEIGVMKAIGIRSIHIRVLYLIKYFVLIGVAATIGCIVSIPLSKKSLDMVVSGGNMMFLGDRVGIMLNILTAIFTMVIVMFLCLISTRKIRKISAIEAIRSGMTGERYTRKSIISLKNTKRIKTTFFMALNDIFSEAKRYLSLILTFIMGTVLVILALNTITSMTSDEMAENFCIDTEADFFLSSEFFANEETDVIIDKAKEDIKSAGYECDVKFLAYYTISFYEKGSDDILSCMTMQSVGDNGKYIKMAVGDTPLLENEIAMSAKVMRKLGVNVGDTICAKFGTEEKEFVITGKYANYSQLGESALISSSTDLSSITRTGNAYLQITLSGIKESEKADAIKDIKKKLPGIGVMSSEEVIAVNLGSEMDKFSNLKHLILLLVCGINVMITVLMVKIFIIGEKGQIAMLRAIGFSVKHLKMWQMFRIGIILIISNLLGIVFSLFLNNLLLKPVFAMMGAEYMKIHVDYIEAYLISPLILLAVTSVSAFIGAGKLKKLKIMEINNIE